MKLMPTVARWFFVVLITLAAWLPLQVTVGMAVGFVCRMFDCSMEVLFRPTSVLLMATVSLAIAASIAVPAGRKVAASIFSTAHGKSQ